MPAALVEGRATTLQRTLAQIARALDEVGCELPAIDATRGAQWLIVALSWLRPARPITSWDALETAFAESAPGCLYAELISVIRKLPEQVLAELTVPSEAPEILAQLLLNWHLERTVPPYTWSAVAGKDRRRAGAHYTPRGLARLAAERALSPWLNAERADVTQLRVCDPSLGAGIFLEEAGLLLSQHATQLSAEGVVQARITVFSSCLYGIDISPLAVTLTRLSLWRASGADAVKDISLAYALCAHCVCGDALQGAVPSELDAPKAAYGDWQRFFIEVFHRPNPGFDAVLGNPPWVAFVGRAAQPLARSAARYYEGHFQSFKKYRTLHGLFVERAAQLARLGGRLGLILPTSMADLDGYAPARAAHDALCVAEERLPNFGDRVFEQVFQPCMLLLSERSDPEAPRANATWSLLREDLDREQLSLLDRLRSEPPLPAHLFGERGYQTSQQDQLTLSDDPPSAQHVALRTGSDVLEYSTLPPRCYTLPETLSGRLRPTAEWHSVKLLLRQTARYPIVTKSDGVAFRNSVLAGFEDEAFSWQLLLAYLNSTPIRWLHYHWRRDARQGMPQLKIGHLRELPRPPLRTDALGQQLHVWGEQLATRNSGVTANERSAIDRVVASAWRLTETELGRILEWGSANPPPSPRRLARP